MPRFAVERNSASVDIEGLAAFIAEAKRVAPNLVVEVASANFDAANGIVIAARTKAQGVGWPGSTATAAKTLGASKSSQRAMVRLGGSRAPWAFGAEFGAKKYKQFAPWRGNQWAGFDTGVGYFLHPAIRESWPMAREAYLARVDAAMKAAFPD